MADIFISYSRNDRPVAEVIARACEANGWSVWWDRKIDAGDTFDQIIEREIEAARCALVLWSRDSVASEWVRNEAAAAMERATMVPAMIDSVRLPIEFRRRQTVDLTDWDRTENPAALADLLYTISQKLGQPAQPAAPRVATSRRRSWTSRTRWIVGGCAVAALAIGTSIPLMHTPSTSFKLECMGGGPFGIHSEGLFKVRVAFVRAEAPHQSSGLLPGQCAWTDRAVNDQEPAELCYSGMSASSLSDRFSENKLLGQTAHYDPENTCLRLDKLM